MKKLALIATVSVLLASCGGSGWSCKKRYCDINKTQIKKTCKQQVKAPATQLVVR